MYLNRVFFGASAYGIEAAARVYFNKYARNLGVLESAMMVGLLPAPNRFNPHRNFELSRDRGFRVIEQMVEAGTLTRQAADRAKAQGTTLAASRSAWGGVYPRGTQIGWFARLAENEASANSAVTGKKGTRTITTTLDPRIQSAAERHLLLYGTHDVRPRPLCVMQSGPSSRVTRMTYGPAPPTGRGASARLDS